MTDNAAPTHSGQWKKGQSGNPAGMPKGTRHRATRMAEQLFEGEAEDVCRAVISAAKNGDMTAARIIVERLCPPRKDRPIAFELPPISNAQDLPQAAIGLLKAVAESEVSPDEAAAVIRVVEAVGKVIALADIEARIAALEKRVRK